MISNKIINYKIMEIKKQYLKIVFHNLKSEIKNAQEDNAKHIDEQNVVMFYEILEFMAILEK